MDITRYSPDLAAAQRDNIYYALTMFPYPSGSGLHCGHASVMTINDVHARYQRMLGKTVFQPFGFDAFGLPTENYAMKVGKPAYEVTEENKAKFIEQLQALNLSFDRERMIDTSKPDYYKRTQWIFQKLYTAGLVYRDELRVNRCPDCQTVLANDQVVNGSCERCKHDIIQKKMPQWFIKITDYADRLLEDLDTIDRPEETKTGQRNRIGKSQGAEIDFEVTGLGDPSTGSGGHVCISCFTTRPDTMYGVTALVLAPENTLLDELLDDEHRAEVYAYRQQALAKTAVQRQQDAKDKTGVCSGLYAIHPLTGKELPIWFADYVLADYGSGAVMMVPAHDERDHAFAEKFGIEIIPVITGESPLPNPLLQGEGTCPTVSLKQYKETPAYIVSLAQQLRTDQTNAERILWEVVRAKRLYNTKWRRQHPFGRYIADFYCHEYKLVIELDGDTHVGIDAEEYDAIRTEFIAAYDVEVIRFSNDEIYTNLEGVCEMIINYMNDHPLLQGEGGGEVYTGQGVLIDSAEFTGLSSQQAQQDISDYLVSLDKGRIRTTYKLRDRSVSRQRYWGSPIPVWYDEQDTIHLIPESELPVELPLDVENYKPKGKSPLEDHPTFPIYKKGLKALLIHGRGNSSIDAGCLTGVQQTLESIGVEVIFPDLTYHKDYNFDNTMKVLLQHDADIVVGHSSGGFLALHYASIKKPGRTILISPTCESMIEDADTSVSSLQYDTSIVGLLDTWLGEAGREKYIAFHNHAVDFVWLKDQQIDVFFGAKDDILNDSIIGRYDTMSPVILSERGHMGSSESTNSIDEINTFLKSEMGNVTSMTYRRECDTLDTFMCSSFYFLRYPDAHNNDELISRELANKAFPIDLYTGGKEHTVGHLLYARFIHKFLYDQGYVDTAEPVKKLVHQGMVLGADGRKMGKRYGNGVDPLQVVEKYGADAVRMYLMFMGPVEQDKIRNDGALNGVKKFLDRVERLLTIERRGEEHDVVTSVVHQTIQGVTHDLEHLKLNTAVSKFMILVNAIYDHKAVTTQQLEILTLLLAPFATELAEKMWSMLGHVDDVHFARRPVADISKIQQSSIQLPIQINGKMRGKIDIDAGLDEIAVLDAAKAVDNIQKRLEGKEIIKVIYVQDKILNIIIK